MALGGVAWAVAGIVTGSRDRGNRPGRWA